MAQETSLQRLGATLGAYPSVLVALSGGVDSSVVAAVAHRVKGSRTTAVALKGPSMPSKDLKAARDIARITGIRYVELEVDQLSSREYRANPTDRCYFCRKLEGGKLVELAAELKLDVVADGVHLDDLNTDRPGLRALKEWGIRHPLVEAGLDKNGVRSLAGMLGLPNRDTPSNSCLASRIAHGDAISASLMDRIDRAEEFVGSLGFSRVRVRVTGRQARVEVGTAQALDLTRPATWDRVRCRLEELGFEPVAPGDGAPGNGLRVLP